MVVCTLCKKDLPESAFYKSTLKRGGRRCKHCQNQALYAYLKNRRARRIEQQRTVENKTFEELFGGYMLTILNSVKKGEYRFVLRGTNGSFLETNDRKVFEAKFFEILKASEK